MGYNAFALIYRPGAQTACEDLSRAIAFIHEYADKLEVDTDGYSLWGGSAGGRMADWVGTYGTEYDDMLERLQLDYLDCVYLHHPAGDYMAAYHDLEEAYRQGKVRAIDKGEEGRYFNINYEQMGGFFTQLAE